MAGDSGVTGTIADLGSLAYIMVAFLSISLYNFLELNFIILYTFKIRRGLYFISFLVSTWGILAYALGFVVKYFDLEGPSSGSIPSVTLIVVGWICMVTGQSVVLYSRLHLVLHDSPRQLRLVLIMVVTNAFIGHVPTVVLVYGANVSPNPDVFIQAYSIYERVQVTIFFLQELVISGLYIVATLKHLKMGSTLMSMGRKETGRRLMMHLIYVNTIIVILDVTILALEYAGLYSVQTTYKGMVYSIKLKLEFGILNRLVELTRSTRSGRAGGAGAGAGSSYSHNQSRARCPSRGGGSGGDIDLDTFGASSQAGNQMQRTVVKCKAAHTGRAARGSEEDDFGFCDIDGVVVTTDIHVQTDKAGKEDVKDGVSEAETPAAEARAASKSSSEIQFAQLGV
ncbi:integral membrane protein [Zalerion maritima]|uniref:Integral membrane protein n=1 Tax=Zalerion maritima TaxID=339359 RepID=A0AAD5WSZ4_9PEZI|nr:integral membrane protein [Zalerion maritima]